MSERLQPGFLDQIFNSTIGLPQQVFWRIVRALKEDDVDLFSEKGLLDASLLPIVGMFDDHKDDVMPDYMAETLQFADKGQSGFGSQITAAILSDPLTYLTGGLSALGKVGTAAKSASRSSYLANRLRQAAGGSMNKLDDLFKTMSPDDLLKHIDDAADTIMGAGVSKAAEQQKHLRKMAGQIRSNLPQAQARHQRAALKGGATGPVPGMTVSDALQSTRDRQIAIGLPVLSRWGAKYDMPTDMTSWWQVFKYGVNQGGTALATATMANKLAALPGVGAQLKGVVAPLRNLSAGYKVGGEARWAMQKGDQLTPADSQEMMRWLNNDGAAPVVADLNAAIAKNNGDVGAVIRKIEDAYVRAIKNNNLHHDAAYKQAFNSVGVKVKGSGASLYGRLIGQTKDNKFFPDFGKGTSKGKAAIEPLVRTLLDKSQHASLLRQQGRGVITPTQTTIGNIDAAFQLERSKLNPINAAVSTGFYETGKAFKKAINYVFKTGQKSEVGEREYAKFLASVARDNAHVEALAKSLYTKMRTLAGKDDFPMSQADITKVVSKMTELDALPGEIQASFRAFAMNPGDSSKIIKSLDNFMRRQHTTLISFEKMLKEGGIRDSAMRQKLTAALTDEAFSFVEKMDAGADGLRRYYASYAERLRDTKHVVQEFTPNQQTLMARVNNKHTIVGTPLVMTARQATAQAAGKQTHQKVLLGKFEGRQAGTLTDAEIDQALVELEQAGMRSMTGAEITAAAERMPKIQELLGKMRKEGNRLTTGELLNVLSKSGRVTDRIVERTRTVRSSFWPAKRTNWSRQQAEDMASQYGYSLIKRPNGIELVPKSMASHALTGISPLSPTSFKSLGGAMKALRKHLSQNPRWATDYGPGLPSQMVSRKVSKRLRVKAEDILRLRDRKLGLTADELDTLMGKKMVFDDAKLPATARPHWDRLSKLRKRRELPTTHPLHERVITPTTRTVTTRVAPPRGNDGLRLFLQRAGTLVNEDQLSSFAINYARGRLLLEEVADGVQRAERAGLPFQADPTLLRDLEAHITASGASIRNIVEEHLPKEFVGLMNDARSLSGAAFEAAKASGVWNPGSPIAYLPRFFNKQERARITQIIDGVEQVDGAVLERLGKAQAQYFARHSDEMSIEDLNDYYFALREVMNESGNAKLHQFHKELDTIMETSGVGIAGVKKNLKFSKAERLETDPFLALVQRWNVAQQDKNLRTYFDDMLSASTGKNGESLMLGGKLVGIVDDTNTVHKIPRLTSRVKQGPKRKTSEVKTVEQVEEIDNYTPKQFIIELDNGTQHVIDNSMLNETGYGMLELGKMPKMTAEGTSLTTGHLFTQASLRSDLHTKLIRKPILDANDAGAMLGKHVVFGHSHNITGLVKTAAQVHKVTPPALRTIDAINYGIKSFQTIFRLPFHIANLSSGVFQAHLAGATPKNIMASYIDTMRYMFGNEEFARHASMVTDFMGVEGQTISRGITSLLRGERTAIQQATQAHGDGSLAAFLAKQDPAKAAQLDQVEDLVIRLGNGTEIDMAEFIQTAGEMQLYGTFASSLTRGSRTTADNLMRIKMHALEPSAGGLFEAPKRLMTKAANVAETSEVLNRTATALALVREGHPMSRAIEIAKEAHVPYEKLTPFEKNAMKRVSVYYSFPRHYMPWAWARFMEDPAKLTPLTHFIRDQKLVSTDEGKPNLVVGDYRIDLGRLNANLEAAGLVAAFADRIAMPAMEQLAPSIVSPFDVRKLGQQYSDAGFTAVGGAASVLLPGSANIFGDPSREAGGKNSLEEAADLVWPLKMLNVMLGNRPSPNEETPWVQYTPMEMLLTSNVIGPGVRKVREQHEVTRANISYRKMLRRIQTRAAATQDPIRRQELLQRAQELAMGMRRVAQRSRQKVFQ
jgi:hypothetical protein